jgi:hypothetical protein
MRPEEPVTRSVFIRRLLLKSETGVPAEGSQVLLLLGRRETGQGRTEDQEGDVDRVDLERRIETRMEHRASQGGDPQEMEGPPDRDARAILAAERHAQQGGQDQREAEPAETDEDLEIVVMGIGLPTLVDLGPVEVVELREGLRAAAERSEVGHHLGAVLVDEFPTVHLVVAQGLEAFLQLLAAELPSDPAGDQQGDLQRDLRPALQAAGAPDDGHAYGEDRQLHEETSPTGGDEGPQGDDRDERQQDDMRTGPGPGGRARNTEEALSERPPEGEADRPDEVQIVRGGTPVGEGAEGDIGLIPTRQNPQQIPAAIQPLERSHDRKCRGGKHHRPQEDRDPPGRNSGEKAVGIRHSALLAAHPEEPIPGSPEEAGHREVVVERPQGGRPIVAVGKPLDRLKVLDVDARADISRPGKRVRHAGPGVQGGDQDIRQQDPRQRRQGSDRPTMSGSVRPTGRLEIRLPTDESLEGQQQPQDIAHTVHRQDGPPQRRPERPRGEDHGQEEQRPTDVVCDPVRLGSWGHRSRCRASGVRRQVSGVGSTHSSERMGILGRIDTDGTKNGLTQTREDAKGNTEPEPEGGCRETDGGRQDVRTRRFQVTPKPDARRLTPDAILPPSMEAADLLAALARDHLVVDPPVGLLHADPQLGVRLPAEHALDQCVVGVAAIDPLRRVQLVGPLQLDPGDLLHDVHQLVDGHQLAAPDVDRLHVVAVGQHLGALQAVVDVHERTGLLAVAPDLDLVLPAQLRRDDLPAGRRRGLFPAAVVGAVRTVHVVVPGHPGLHAVVLAEMTAHPLAEELLPTVAVLRKRRIRIGLLEGGDVRILLLVAVVDAGAGGVEEPLDADVLGRHQQVGVDQHRQHAQRLVVLDEPHPAHVGGVVVDGVGALERRVAVRLVVQVENQVLHVLEALVPPRLGLDVHAPQPGVPLPTKVRNQVAADEAATATYYDQVIFVAHGKSVRIYGIKVLLRVVSNRSAMDWMSKVCSA